MGRPWPPPFPGAAPLLDPDWDEPPTIDELRRDLDHMFSLAEGTDGWYWPAPAVPIPQAPPPHPAERPEPVVFITLRRGPSVGPAWLAEDKAAVDAAVAEHNRDLEARGLLP
jgi:hypothetical protein